MRIGKHTLGTLACWLLIAQAHAIQITSAGQSWTVDWSIRIDANTSVGATSNWYVSSFSTSQLVLEIDVNNTTYLTGLLTSADITSFGFGTNRDIEASLLAAGETFDTVGTGMGRQQTFPGGFKHIDVCLFTSSCAGGSVGDALHTGSSDSLQLLLTGNFSRGILELRSFPMKFQTTLESFHEEGCINKNPACMPVPEPAIGTLVGLGLALIGLSRWSRTQYSTAATRQHRSA